MFPSCCCETASQSRAQHWAALWNSQSEQSSTLLFMTLPNKVITDYLFLGRNPRVVNRHIKRFLENFCPYLMPSSLARFFTRWQVLINRRQMPEIGGKSVLVHASDNRAVNLNIWHAKYLELSAIQNLAVWMSSDWIIHWRWPTANERARYRAAGSSGRIFFFRTFLF